MIINFIGDSITEGVGVDSVEKVYPSIVAKKLGVTTNNYGVSGTRIARQTTPTVNAPDFDRDFNMRAVDMDKNADLVFVFGGTNDFGHGDAPMGEWGDTTLYTFNGGLKNLLEYLIGVYGKQNICYILPLHRPDENDPFAGGAKRFDYGTLKDYTSAIKNATAKLGIDTINFDEEFALSKNAELTVDGVHPNEKGQQILAEKVIQYIKNREV